MTMKPVEQLIEKNEQAWPLILDWKQGEKNSIEILPKKDDAAETALYQTQVTTRSPMGAIIYETGGIIVDRGWLRILGSGSRKLTRSLPAWNKGKSFAEYGEPPSFLLVADDVLGGFFALNGGGLARDGLGNIFYLPQDTLRWESLNIGYSQFIQFCFSGNLQKFYEGWKWKTWQADVDVLSGDEVFNFVPPLYTKEGKNIETSSKRKVPIEESWELALDLQKQLKQ